MKPVAVIAVIVVAGLVGGAVGYGVYKVSAKTEVIVTPVPPAAPAASKEEKFIEEARKLAETTPPAKEEQGALPPVNGDQSEVPIIATEPEGTLDLGTVQKEGLASGQLKVLNKGKANLVISQVKTSCGCTKARIEDDKKSIPPGGHSVITVDVNPKLISGAVSHKTLTILSNDPVHGTLTVDVVARIDPEYVLEPSAVEFGEVQKGTMVEKNVILRQAGDEAIEIIEVRPPAQVGGLETSFKKRPENEWAAPNRPEYVITVTLTQDAPAGTLSANLSVQTTCKRMAVAQLPVKGEVKAFYEITPPPMRQLLVNTSPQLGQNTPAAPAKITIKADRPFEVIDLQASSPALSVTSVPGESPNVILIQVTASPDAKAGRLPENVSFGIKAGDQVFREKYNVRVMANRSPQAPPAVPGVSRAPAVPAVPSAMPPVAAEPAPAVPAPPATPPVPEPTATPGTPAPPAAATAPVPEMPLNPVVPANK